MTPVILWAHSKLLSLREKMTISSPCPEATFASYLNQVQSEAFRCCLETGIIPDVFICSMVPRAPPLHLPAKPEGECEILWDTAGWLYLEGYEQLPLNVSLCAKLPLRCPRQKVPKSGRSAQRTGSILLAQWHLTFGCMCRRCKFQAILWI